MLTLVRGNGVLIFSGSPDGVDVDANLYPVAAPWAGQLVHIARREIAGKKDPTTLSTLSNLLRETQPEILYPNLLAWARRLHQAGKYPALTQKLLEVTAQSLITGKAAQELLSVRKGEGTLAQQLEFQGGQMMKELSSPLWLIPFGVAGLTGRMASVGILSRSSRWGWKALAASEGAGVLAEVPALVFTRRLGLQAFAGGQDLWSTQSLWNEMKTYFGPFAMLRGAGQISGALKPLVGKGTQALLGLSLDTTAVLSGHLLNAGLGVEELPASRSQLLLSSLLTVGHIRLGGALLHPWVSKWEGLHQAYSREITRLKIESFGAMPPLGEAALATVSLGNNSLTKASPYPAKGPLLTMMTGKNGSDGSGPKALPRSNVIPFPVERISRPPKNPMEEMAKKFNDFWNKYGSGPGEKDSIFGFSVKANFTTQLKEIRAELIGLRNLEPSGNKESPNQRSTKLFLKLLHHLYFRRSGQGTTREWQGKINSLLGEARELYPDLAWETSKYHDAAWDHRAWSPVMTLPSLLHIRQELLLTDSALSKTLRSSEPNSRDLPLDLEVELLHQSVLVGLYFEGAPVKLREALRKIGEKAEQGPETQEAMALLGEVFYRYAHGRNHPHEVFEFIQKRAKGGPLEAYLRILETLSNREGHNPQSGLDFFAGEAKALNYFLSGLYFFRRSLNASGKMDLVWNEVRHSWKQYPGFHLTIPASLMGWKTPAEWLPAGYLAKQKRSGSLQELLWRAEREYRLLKL